MVVGSRRVLQPHSEGEVGGPGLDKHLSLDKSVVETEIIHSPTQWSREYTIRGLGAGEGSGSNTSVLHATYA